MIVGESHYARENDPVRLRETIKRYQSTPEHTRSTITESAINREWPNKTLGVTPRLVLGYEAENRGAFWSLVAYHNLIQRVMRYGDPPERPTQSDIDAGWRFFASVVGTLAPDLVIVFGSCGFSRFRPCMEVLQVPCKCLPRVAKIGRCWAYAGEVIMGDKRTPLIFTQHPGKCFKWREWHAFLASRHPEVIDRLEKR